MKKRIFAMAVIAICLAILAYGTTAYYTAEGAAHSVITSGKVDVEIQEWQQTSDGLEPYPGEPIRVMPATTVSKLVTVKNHDGESFIRAKCEIILRDASGNVKPIEPKELARIVTLDVNTEQWRRKAGDDIWWYCESAVPAGAITAPLFTQVVFDGPNMSNEYQNCTVEVIVTAQAVQTAHNAQTAREAQGWPAE